MDEGTFWHGPCIGAGHDPDPANLAQRILDTARIATAIHLEQDAQDGFTEAEQLNEGSTETISE